jgi:hypothetical protein
MKLADKTKNAAARQLRRAMETFKFTGGVNKFRDKLANGLGWDGSVVDIAAIRFAATRCVQDFSRSDPRPGRAGKVKAVSRAGFNIAATNRFCRVLLRHLYRRKC